MITKRDSYARGPTDAGWLKSKHSFSFAHYYDAEHMGFGPLRVINEDEVIAGAGFETHPHNNMEIISYVIEGELAHKDSIGNGSLIKPGDIQLMSAGTGVTHSEFNGSKENPVHFLQIWIMPNVLNQAPGYQQKYFAAKEQQNRFRVVVSPDGEQESLVIKQDARLLVGKFDANLEFGETLDPGRKYWIQTVRGEAKIQGETALAGDGFAIKDETAVQLKIVAPTELLLFDLPG